VVVSGALCVGVAEKKGIESQRRAEGRGEEVGGEGRGS